MIASHPLSQMNWHDKLKTFIKSYEPWSRYYIVSRDKLKKFYLHLYKIPKNQTWNHSDLGGRASTHNVIYSLTTWSFDFMQQIRNILLPLPRPITYKPRRLVTKDDCLSPIKSNELTWQIKNVALLPQNFWPKKFKG